MEARVAEVQAGTFALRLKLVCLVVQGPLSTCCLGCLYNLTSFLTPTPLLRTATSCPLATLLFVLDVSSVAGFRTQESPEYTLSSQLLNQTLTSELLGEDFVMY